MDIRSQLKSNSQLDLGNLLICYYSLMLLLWFGYGLIKLNTYLHQQVKN